MVIFHSYVSLPEGTCYSLFAYIHCTHLNIPSMALVLGLPTWLLSWVLMLFSMNVHWYNPDACWVPILCRLHFFTDSNRNQHNPLSLSNKASYQHLTITQVHFSSEHNMIVEYWTYQDFSIFQRRKKGQTNSECNSSWTFQKLYMGNFQWLC